MRTLIAGIVAGVVVFLWGAVSHAVLPTGTMGLQVMPGEDAVIAALRQNVTKPGVYFFPGADMTRKMTAEEERAWTAKIAQGPVGLLAYRATGSPLSARMLLNELLSNIAAAIVAAIVLSRTVAGYGTRVVITALLGLFAWLSISVSYWNWYGFTAPFEVAELIDQVGGWLFGGLVLGKLAPTRAANG